MPRRDEVIASMRDALQVQDPEWDISPGSPEWKILEAVAQQIENITFNSVLNDYHFDVDKKAGLELDLFMSLFGFARIRARRATGEVTFQRGTPALQDYIIPLGTQVFVPATAFNPALYFQTTISAVLPQGATEVSVPVQAVVGGSTGNVAAFTITGMATAVGGVTAVINSQAISGGRDAESDEDLRDRWRATVFRNISGTEDQFLGLAYNEAGFVTRANLVGPIERYVEQIQLEASYDLTTPFPWTATLVEDLDVSETGVDVGTGQGDRFPLADADNFFYIAIYDGGWREIMKVTSRVAGGDTMTVVRATGAQTHSNGALVRQVFPSSVTDSAFTYPPGGEIVGLDIGLTTQQVGRRGSDYELITDRLAVPAPAGTPFPSLYVTIVGAANFGLDSVIEMEHEYTPLSSRNDPANKVAEKVDLFVDGVDPLAIVEQIPFREDNVFGDADTEESDFLRDDGVNQPVAGNIFTELSKSPIASFPTSITVAATATTEATTFYKDEDYWLVTDKTVMEGSPRGRNGIEWRSPGPAATGTFSVSRQNESGKLDGYYTYVYTFEIDGVESLPSAFKDADDKNIKATFGKNDLLVPLATGAGTTKWRKIYRTFGASGGFDHTQDLYLLKVIKNNTTIGFTDNKADSALDINIRPPKSLPPVDAPLAIEYSYNQLIERLDAQVDLVRLVGMDTLVHEADDIQLKFNLAVVVVPGMNISDLKADINTNLSAWIRRKSFQNNVQIADLIDTVANSVGVDNVRLAFESEARNEVQKITVTPPNSPDANRDKFTIKIGDNTSGAIVYNDTAVEVREILEAMPNIHEGNTYATQLAEDVDTFETAIDVTDIGSLHTDGNAANPLSVMSGYYFQVNNEIMYVESAVDNGGTQTLTVKRAQLGTSASEHNGTIAPYDDIHVLGDVAVSRLIDGDGRSIYTLTFLPNHYTGVNNWGTRELDLVVAAKATENSQVTLAVAEKVSGSGWGIQKIARNDLTIIDSFTTLDDIYLASDELPSLFAVDVIVKAQNTF